MGNKRNAKLAAITPETLIVGIDIAKKVHWARFIDYRGIEIGRAEKITNDKRGYENILTTIRQHCNTNCRTKVIIGMEPTGHYWKTLAWFLENNGLEIVLINPMHTSRAKELEDNNQSKNDQKDAIVIAHLVRDGHYLESYLPDGCYADLRGLSASWETLAKSKSAFQNTLVAILDEYFPELTEVFKDPIASKAARQILKTHPLPAMIKKLGMEGIIEEMQKAVRKTVGQAKAQKLLSAAETSIGITVGAEAAATRIKMLITHIEQIEESQARLLSEMKKYLEQTGISAEILSIPCIGVLSAASLLAEIGDPTRFENPRQLFRLAGLNLVAQSSGKHVGSTTISKRGRALLRMILYQTALVMVAARESEAAKLHQYLKTRPKNPLAGKESLIVIAKKILTLIYYLVKKHETYNKELFLGEYRKNQMTYLQAA